MAPSTRTCTTDRDRLRFHNHRVGSVSPSSANRLTMNTFAMFRFKTITDPNMSSAADDCWEHCPQTHAERMMQRSSFSWWLLAACALTVTFSGCTVRHIRHRLGSSFILDWHAYVLLRSAAPISTHKLRCLHGCT